jgi:hypothetical protein
MALRRIKQHLLNWSDGKIPAGLLPSIITVNAITDFRIFS